jgi:hypothetical protein
MNYSRLSAAMLNREAFSGKLNLSRSTSLIVDRHSGKCMQPKSTAVFLLLALALSDGADASSFDDYGGFSKYRQSLADGGGCISGTVGTSIPGKNFNTIVYFAGSRYGEKARFNKAYFGFTALDKKHDLDNSTLRASAFQMCLKPGNYEIIGIEARGMESTKELRMPFTVEAGKNIYLGSLIFHSDPIRTASCGSINPDAVEIVDDYARDLPFIMKRKDAITPESRLLDARQGMPYFFSCPS